MKKHAFLGMLALMGAASSADAFEFRCRFVERIGTTDIPIPDNGFPLADTLAHNIRIQFGVFDNAMGAAPAGGFVGWNVGTILVSGPADNSDERRNPGRLAPFNFAFGPNVNGNPPLPGGDPFTMLTEIDATLGTQSPMWHCNPDGTIPPQPGPTIRGLNTFVSVYAFSIDPSDSAVNYTITFGGNLIAATEWRGVGMPNPPDCGDPSDPGDDIPGSVTWAPFPTAPRSFTCVLAFVPGPSTGALFGLGALLVARRRR